MYTTEKSNLFKQGTKILHAIAEHIEYGDVDNPESNDILMQLFLLISEGKVSGLVCPDTGRVKWSLSKQYEKELRHIREEYNGENIVEGPWQ